MYETIDEIDTTDETPVSPQKARYFITLFVILGFAVILAAAIWSAQHTPNVTAHPAQQIEATKAFRRIQGESRLSIRRALLLDYVKNYPQSPTLNGAKQQLRVMDDYEAADWAKLSDIMFDETLTSEDKIFALERYVAAWGEGLIGSRDNDITAFKAALDVTPDERTNKSRKLITEKSPIPDTIDAGQMAGGRAARPSPPRYPAPRPTPRAAQPQAIITPARIRRSRTPEYPRRALSRGVPAIVELSLNIDERGRVGLIELVGIDAPRYHRDFERAARRAAKRTRFHPQTVNGTAVPSRDIRKTYVFDPSL